MRGPHLEAERDLRAQWAVSGFFHWARCWQAWPCCGEGQHFVLAADTALAPLSRVVWMETEGRRPWDPAACGRLTGSWHGALPSPGQPHCQTPRTASAPSRRSATGAERGNAGQPASCLYITQRPPKPRGVSRAAMTQWLPSVLGSSPGEGRVPSHRVDIRPCAASRPAGHPRHR